MAMWYSDGIYKLTKLRNYLQLDTSSTCIYRLGKTLIDSIDIVKGAFMPNLSHGESVTVYLMDNLKPYAIVTITDKRIFADDSEV